MRTKKYQNIELSCLGMGNMRLPQNEKQEIDYQKSQEIIDYAMANGVNYYDTAYVYNNGESEKFLGHAMKKYDRNSFYLATKFNIGANPDYKAVFEEQLKRLQTDYIDFYLVHCLMDSNANLYKESGCIPYFMELKKQGKIKYLGFSNHASQKVFEDFVDYHHWDFVQIQFNYYDYLYGNARKEYEYLEKKGIPVMVMEPVRGGRLARLTKETDAQFKNKNSDYSIASWALRFVDSMPGVQVILSGMSTYEQVVDNVDTFSNKPKLRDKEKTFVLDVCEQFSKELKVPCTACRYCTEDCPKKINIPEILKVYNRFAVDGPWALRGLKNVETIGKPQECIGCNKCKGHCPQGIDVPKIMNHIKELVGDKE